MLVCDDVLRQTGSLGVVKMANVELHEEDEEHTRRGAARVGVDELPVELKAQTNRPIMFAYRYLAPPRGGGESMHRLFLNLQNSRRQCLELRGLPKDARLW